MRTISEEELVEMDLEQDLELEWDPEWEWEWEWERERERVSGTGTGFGNRNGFREQERVSGTGTGFGNRNGFREQERVSGQFASGPVAGGSPTSPSSATKFSKEVVGETSNERVWVSKVSPTERRTSSVAFDGDCVVGVMNDKEEASCRHFQKKKKWKLPGG